MITPVQKMISAYKDNLDDQSRPGFPSGPSNSLQRKAFSPEASFEFAKILKKAMDRAEKQSSDHRK